MSKNININVHYITRVEGHGNIIVNAGNGRIEKVRWEVPEAPRFFEAMVRGHSYEDIQIIATRICGICSISHSFSAIKAVENAMDIKVSEQTDMLRGLLHYSEQFQSHILHIGYLAAPDFFGEKSVLPLAGKAIDAVKKIIGVHRLANDWSNLIGGRKTHPVRIIPGGFTKIPTAEELKELQGRIQKGLEDLKVIAEVLLGVAGNIPKFERETEYVCLKQTKPPAYTFYQGDITSTDIKGKTVPVHDWHSVIREYVVEQSTAKWARWNRQSYMCGALARFNNNADLLSDGAKKAAKLLGLKRPCYNPFMNTIAQLVECVHICETAIEMIDKLLSRGLSGEDVKVKVKAGVGVGITEAPRGMLIHEYEFDKAGKCVAADMCIPTNPNHANIQLDMEKFVPQIIDEGEDAVRHKLEMLVRAYDPCISCSAHFLNIKFIR
jgi:coenzyme F420-reducing hydrogenase alpha subunit